MKKYILLVGLSLLIHIETKSQTEGQFIATGHFSTQNKTVLPWNITLATTRYSTLNVGPDKDYAFYLRRSKNYRIVGLSTLGAGLISSGIGVLIATGNQNSNSNYDPYEAAAEFFLFGAVSGITSIPFMIMAHAYKSKARLLMENKQTGIGVPSKVGRNIPGITMTIPIGK